MKYDFQGPEEEEVATVTTEESDVAETTDDAEEDSGNLFLPESSLGGRKCEPGDVISLKVVGKTADGELELAVDEKKTDDDYGSSDESDAMELRQALGASKGMPA